MDRDRVPKNYQKSAEKQFIRQISQRFSFSFIIANNFAIFDNFFKVFQNVIHIENGPSYILEYNPHF